MRAFGRDLIRGGHYGQRSCEPHLKAEHMAAPTNAAYVKKALANSEPSTHGTPFGRTPVRRNAFISSAVQLPIPVFLSCVMLPGVTLNDGVSTLRPPDSSLPGITVISGGVRGE